MTRNFDLAWIHNGTTYVAEVKSITDRNEERQLRLGLGRVLRYRALRGTARDSDVRAVLVPERTPRDATWTGTCAGVDVALVPGDQLADGLPGLLGLGAATV